MTIFLCHYYQKMVTMKHYLHISSCLHLCYRSKSVSENSFVLFQETSLPVQDLKSVVLHQHLICLANSVLLSLSSCSGGWHMLLLNTTGLCKKNASPALKSEDTQSLDWVSAVGGNEHLTLLCSAKITTHQHKPGQTCNFLPHRQTFSLRVAPGTAGEGKP